MKIKSEFKSNLKEKEVLDAVQNATRIAMGDTVVDVAHDTVQGSPVLTGNNRRSIAFESSGYGHGEGVVDQAKTEGAIYSTSGYGGFLEVGTAKMASRPYFKPALDKNFTKEKFAQGVKDNLK